MLHATGGRNGGATGMRMGPLMRRLEAEELRARRQGHCRRADFLSTLVDKLTLQRQAVELQARRYDAEEKQLQMDAARAAWTIERARQAQLASSRVEEATLSPVPAACPDRGGAVHLPPASVLLDDDPCSQSAFARPCCTALCAAWLLAVCITGVVTSVSSEVS